MEQIMPIINYALQFDFQKLEEHQKKYCYGNCKRCSRKKSIKTIEKFLVIYLKIFRIIYFFLHNLVKKSQRTVLKIAVSLTKKLFFMLEILFDSNGLKHMSFVSKNNETKKSRH